MDPNGKTGLGPAVPSDLERIGSSDIAVRQTDVLTNFAHDLRSPLSSIRTGLEVLKLSLGDPLQAGKIIGMLERQIVEITRLLGDVVESKSPVTQQDDPHLLVEPPPAGVAQRKVLVVDDSRSAADLLTLFFRMEGYEVRSAYLGEEALEVAREMKPDVVFLDLGLPDLSGYEVATQIRQFPGGRDCFIVALTGLDPLDVPRNIAEAGFDLHVVKPPEPGMLREVLKQSSLAKTR